MLRALVMIVCCALSSGMAWAETSVMLTIDTETRIGGSARENLWGYRPQSTEANGVPLILEVLKKHGAKATFYVTPYEYVNETDIADIARLIVRSGNSVQLHTHPEPMFGKLSMWAYDLNTQKEILGKGREMLEAWTGEKIIAHRAGAYTANRDTLAAARSLGIMVDSSLAPAQRSPLAQAGLLANDITEIDGTTELPVTYYAQVRLPGFQSLRALDIESSTGTEIERVLEQMAAQGACTVNIMMHSFSFTRYGRRDEHIVGRLGQVLDFIAAHPQLRVATVPEFIAGRASHPASCTPATGFVPVTGLWTTYLRAWERLSEGGVNIVVALAPPGAVLLLLAAVAVFTRRRPPAA